jgi:hypothetical protein
MKFLVAVVAAGMLTFPALAGDLELGGMKAKVPAGWKEEAPTSNMRLTQFKLPKAEGDSEDAELIVFFFKSGSGSAEDNLKRQLAKFKPLEGKDKVEAKLEKIKIGKYEAQYQDITGTFLSKSRPADPAAKVTEKTNYRQLYVVLLTDNGDFYPTLVGPAKTVEKHKKDFEEVLKGLK